LFGSKIKNNKNAHYENGTEKKFRQLLLSEFFTANLAAIVK